MNVGFFFVLFAKRKIFSSEVFNYMYEEYHDWRLRLLGEVFFFQEKTPSQLLAPEYSRYLDVILFYFYKFFFFFKYLCKMFSYKTYFRTVNT